MGFVDRVLGRPGKQQQQQEQQLLQQQQEERQQAEAQASTSQPELKDDLARPSYGPPTLNVPGLGDAAGGLQVPGSMAGAGVGGGGRLYNPYEGRWPCMLQHHAPERSAAVAAGCMGVRACAHAHAASSSSHTLPARWATPLCHTTHPAPPPPPMCRHQCCHGREETGVQVAGAARGA